MALACWQQRCLQLSVAAAWIEVRAAVSTVEGAAQRPRAGRYFQPLDIHTGGYCDAIGLVCEFQLGALVNPATVIARLRVRSPGPLSALDASIRFHQLLGVLINLTRPLCGLHQLLLLTVLSACRPVKLSSMPAGTDLEKSPIGCTTEKTDPAKFNSWCKKNKVLWPKCTTGVTASTGRCVLASHDIAAGEVVVEVPDDMVLMAENCDIQDILEGGQGVCILLALQGGPRHNGPDCTAAAAAQTVRPMLSQLLFAATAACNDAVTAEQEQCRHHPATVANSVPGSCYLLCVAAHTACSRQ